MNILRWKADADQQGTFRLIKELQVPRVLMKVRSTNLDDNCQKCMPSNNKIMSCTH